MEWNGLINRLEYFDADDFNSLPIEQCSQVYGVCFLGDRIIIVRDGPTNQWSLPGGTIEKGETIERALARELLEETNTKLLRWIPIGAQKVIFPDGNFSYQLRVVAVVEKIGEFISDPGGGIQENKYISPHDVKKYFDWGKIGERIIERGIILAGKISRR